MSMDSGAEQAIHAALRDIFEQLGGINAELKAGHRRHDEFSANIKSLQKTVEPVPGLCKTVEGIQPFVEDYKRSRNIFTGGFLVLSALLGAIMFWGAEIKTALRILFSGKGG